MTPQLWAWKYNGQDEVGVQTPGNSRVFKSAASEALPLLRHTDHITDLHKVKVVDEDAVVLSQKNVLGEFIYPHLKVIHLKQTNCGDHTFVNDECKYCDQVLPTPPVQEPKNFAAVVEAETVGWAIGQKNRRKFVKLEGVSGATWFDEKEGTYFLWRHLINPVIPSNGLPNAE